MHCPYLKKNETPVVSGDFVMNIISSLFSETPKKSLVQTEQKTNCFKCKLGLDLLIM